MKVFYCLGKNLRIEGVSDIKTKTQIIAEFRLLCQESDLQEIVVNEGECATIQGGILTKYNIKAQTPAPINLKTEFAKLSTATEQIDFIAKRLGVK